MTTCEAAKVSFEATGRLWLRGALAEDDLRILDAVGTAGRPGARLDAGGLSGVLGPDGTLGRRLGALWPGMRPVRVVAFSKDAGSNWGVPWHQNRIIAVRDRADLPSYANWSNKAGRWHCEPPLEILEPMLFVRIHLDPQALSNGAMEIAPGSHGFGLIPAEDAATAAETLPHEPRLAERGDVLVLKMLTLHRSRTSQDGKPRRTLRVDYAAAPLPAPLAWSDA